MFFFENDDIALRLARVDRVNQRIQQTLTPIRDVFAFALDKHFRIVVQAPAQTEMDGGSFHRVGDTTLHRLNCRTACSVGFTDSIAVIQRNGNRADKSIFQFEDIVLPFIPTELFIESLHYRTVRDIRNDNQLCRFTVLRFDYLQI